MIHLSMAGEMGDDRKQDEILDGLLLRIAEALDGINTKLGVLVTLSEPRSLQLNSVNQYQN